MKKFKRIMLIIGISLFSILLIFNIVGYTLSGSVYKGPKSDHFDGKKFTNPDNVEAKQLSDVLKWAMNRDKEDWGPIQELEFGDKPASSIDSGMTVTFVNHSTFLIQTAGLNILTDPVWGNRVSPVQFGGGPARLRTPGIKLEDLPEIDLVLITHNHYDHLDKFTVEHLIKVYQPLFVVPLGVSGTVKKWGATNVHELDWHDTFTGLEQLAVTSTPAQHFSGRGTYDRDRTLWCGYVLNVGDKSIYYAGDSGYGRFFKQIGEQYGPFDLSFIPIGAYKPNWFMSPVHISPAEAVDVFADTKTKRAIAMHFGTYPLADEGRKTPVEDLKLALKAKGISEDDFYPIDEGVKHEVW